MFLLLFLSSTSIAYDDLSRYDHVLEFGSNGAKVAVFAEAFLGAKAVKS